VSLTLIRTLIPNPDAVVEAVHAYKK